MKNKKRFKEATVTDVIGTSFIGYLEASYKDLVRTFGEPRWRNKEGPWRSSDTKVRCEWTLKIGSGRQRLVFTIYDYKEVQPVEEVRLWHVGGKGAIDRLPEIFAIDTVRLEKWEGARGS